MLKAMCGMGRLLVERKREHRDGCTRLRQEELQCLCESGLLCSLPGRHRCTYQLTSLRARDNEWQHGQVQAELNRRLIMRRKLLPSEVGRTPMDLMELRHLADYKPQSVSAREAKRAYERAEAFLSSIERALVQAL